MGLYLCMGLSTANHEDGAWEVRKTSIEALLLLTDVYGRKKIAELCEDLKAIEGEQIATLLVRLEEYKSRTYGATAAAIEAELQKRRQEIEAERLRQRQLNETVQEVSDLLFTRYKMRVPQAAKDLSAELARRGHYPDFKGEIKRGELAKWLGEVCNKLPKNLILNAVRNLKPD